MRGAISDKTSKTSKYLFHENEPKNVVRLKVPPPEVESELLTNRFFLKRRVWKNMDKIKRLNSRAVRYRSERRPRTARRRNLPVGA